MGLLLGDAPSIRAADAVAEEDGVVPRENAATHDGSLPPPVRSVPRNRARLWLALIAVAVVVAVLGVWFARRTPSWVQVYEEWAATVALDPVPETGPFDADARLAEIEAAFPQAPRTPPPVLPAAGSVSVHEFGDAVLRALADADPWTELWFGTHPHPHLPPAGDTGALTLATLRIQRAALREIGRWPEAGLSAHDRLDLRLLRVSCEQSLRTGVGTDHDILVGIDELLGWLSWVRDLRCCPAEDRARVAESMVVAVPGVLADALARLRRPAGPAVHAVASRLEDDVPWIVEYPSTWGAIEPTTQSRLHIACERTQEALRSTVERLRNEIAPRATGPLGIGREGYAEVLRGHGLPPDLRAHYRRALAALVEANSRFAAAYSMPGDREPESKASEVLTRLRSRTHAWLPAVPPEPGLEIVPVRHSERRRASGIYNAPGPLSGSPGATISVFTPSADGTPSEDFAERIEWVHTLAHEAYPGHRMASLAARHTCSLRRVFADAAASEGWAMWAEDMIHETGDCSGGRIDEWVRANEAAGHAASTMLEVLCATGAASAGELARLLGHETTTDAPTPGTPADIAVGELALSQGRRVRYLEGLAAIRRLCDEERVRLGGSFSLKDFNARFLAEGGIPIDWVREAWREGR